MATTANIRPVFGAMTIGEPGQEGVRVSELADIQKLFDIFQGHGFDEIDTARIYGGGSTEEYLAAAGYQKRGFKLDTKVHPAKSIGLSMSKERWDHTPEDLRGSLQSSLTALKTKKVRTFYLHAPDPLIKREETLRGIDALYREGHFERFGISNYAAWEVSRICELCRENGWVQPTVYQGLYHAWNRVVEKELFPCLQFYGISFYVWNPLAGGMLTGRHTRDSKAEEGGRFDENRLQGRFHRIRYWNEPNFAALDILQPVAEKHGLTTTECALRWLEHHSVLRNEAGDRIIIGASSAHHLEENLVALEKGPLPQEVVEALDRGYELTKALPLGYHHDYKGLVKEDASK